jgi:hypothetical protein
MDADASDQESNAAGLAMTRKDPERLITQAT